MIYLSSLIKAVALLFYILLVLLTLRSSAEPRLRRFFLVYLSGMIYWQLVSLFINFAREPATALLLYNLLFAGSGMFNVLFLPLTRAFLQIKGQRVLVVLSYVMCAVMLAFGILGLQFKSVYLGRSGYYVPNFYSTELYVEGIVGYFLWGVGVFNLIRGLVVERSAFQRNRIKYVLLGASVVIVGTISNFTFLRDYPVDITANLFSALLIGYAVVRYRLLEIRVVLVRSLFYSLLTAALIAAYVGIVFSLETTLKASIGYSGPLYGIVAIFVLAVVFLPLRNMLQRVIDRLFFREKADFQKATQAFSREIASIYESDEIVAFTCNTIARAMNSGAVSIALYEPASVDYRVSRTFGKHGVSHDQVRFGTQSALARWLRREGQPFLREEALMDPARAELLDENRELFHGSEVVLVAPVLLKDRLLGTINLGPKLAGTMYTAEDLRFLATIASQTATALEKSTVYREIQRRLSEQTLLFILSEKFRGSTDFDLVMQSIVVVLKSFLSCDYCALVCFDNGGSSRIYATDPVSERAAFVASRVGSDGAGGIASGDSTQPVDAQRIRALVANDAMLEDGMREIVASLVYLPLQSGDELLGMLVLPDRSGGASIDQRELELLRTVRAIISQGIALDRTIVNLVNVKTYNENILNSLNDMGDSLVILDLDGNIKSANRATCERLGYTEEELRGRHMTVLTRSEGSLFSPAGLARLAQAGSVTNYDVHYFTKSGTAIPMLFSGSIMSATGDKGSEIVGIARDISEHMKAEEMAKNALLIKEIHHRIKNNLQVISSLLFLQSGYVSDQRTKEMFVESQNRVRSMALLHEKLYLSERPNGLNFSEYIHDLTKSLAVSYALNSASVNVSVNIAATTLGMDTAVPCGLIVNELVSNAFKHAFPDRRAGNVQIVMRPVDDPSAGAPGISWKDKKNWYELIVADDGRGFPHEIDFRTTDSLGMKVVCTLTKQLGGEIELERNGGTRFTIVFAES